MKIGNKRYGFYNSEGFWNLCAGKQLCATLAKDLSAMGEFYEFTVTKKFIAEVSVKCVEVDDDAERAETP